MDPTMILGLTAGVITSVSFAPQVVKAYRTKKLEDVSYFMYILLSVGLILWLLYGYYLEEIPIILANGFGIACCILTLLMKKMYSQKH